MKGGPYFAWQNYTLGSEAPGQFRSIARTPSIDVDQIYPFFFHRSLLSHMKYSSSANVKVVPYRALFLGPTFYRAAMISQHMLASTLPKAYAYHRQLTHQS